ncbi:MAG TPA: choice-of-anchor P family protein [Actinocrinis sp.]|nr:choice-of-anchor P family protein [Actinocrinis sp.]
MCTAVPAHAALTSPEANAYVVSATLAGASIVAPTPDSTYAPGGTFTVANLAVGPFASNATATATTAGDPTTGDSSASATVDTLGVTLSAIAALNLTGVDSTCTATPAGATGSGLIAGGNLSLLGIATPLNAAAAPNTTVTIPGVGSLVLNEQTTDPATGILTVNAVDVTITGGTELIIGHAACGGAPAVVATPMVNGKAAAGGLAAAGTLALVNLRRKRRTAFSRD